MTGDVVRVMCQRCGQPVESLAGHFPTCPTGDVGADVTQALRQTSDEGLLRTFAALTHRMHAATDLKIRADFRAQRDILQTEILRRMRGTQRESPLG